MIRRPPRSTQSRSSAASDVYKRQSIVYFERLKEDIREGRTMRSSSERAYKSAFRTIIAADTVSFAAAAILYIFAVGSVKGFAFTLGMATVFDVFISYFFVRPMTALLSQWRFF